jgi:[glutamine synthetase] adenylyltransferase / [glutamine synthetase]-adenylyl-L-tyrosine phosphorylase
MARLSDQNLAMILDRPGGRPSAMLLAGCGFAVPRKASSLLAELADCCGRPMLLDVAGQLLEYISACSDPDGALGGLLRLAQGVEGPVPAGALLKRLAGNAEESRLLFGFLSYSRVLAVTLARNPKWIGEVVDSGEVNAPHSGAELQEQLQTLIGASNTREQYLALLRQFRKRHTLGIASRDISARADLQQTTEEISALAEAIVEGGLTAARKLVLPASGSFCVLALGKLGGNELNYSSDIDLLFIGQPADQNSDRLAAELVRLLSEPTPEGVAYRVDMRLRPEGSSGALVLDPESALAYYRSRAGGWERQALLKARPIAGDLELGRKLLEDLQEFIWRSGLSPAQVARACQLRSDMVKAVDAGPGWQEVKSGVGGIRDVEFSVQIMQLAYGAKIPELRRTGTLQAIEALENAGLLAATQAVILRSGYEFLRRVEHCLQTMDELALHAVPADIAERAALARRLGYPGSPESAREEFECDLERHSSQLRKIYSELCGQGAAGINPGGRLGDLLADGDQAELLSLLSVQGFGSGRRAARAVRHLADCAAGQAGVVAEILERLRNGPSQDRGLFNLEAVLDGQLMQLLLQDSELKEALISVLERSDFLAALLASNRREYVPMLRSGSEGRPRRGRQCLLADLQGFLEECPREEIAGRLSTFRERELVRVGARDLLDDESPERISSELSYLAEIQIEFAVGIADLPDSLVILALGRLGGREMSYGSDLDLVFVETDAEGDSSSAVHECIRILSDAGYDVDTRLRPGGGSGQLVSSLAGYKSYRDRGELACWERLALVRARAVAGGEAARKSVAAFLNETLYRQDPGISLAQETWKMRLKLEETAGQDDFKRGSGGLLDLEFLAEFLALSYGPKYQSMRCKGTSETISAAVDEGILPAAEAAHALGAHNFLCRLEMRARVLGGKAVRSLPADPEELGRLARIMSLPEAEHPSVVAATAETVRQEFERYTTSARRLLLRALGQ